MPDEYDDEIEDRQEPPEETPLVKRLRQQADEASSKAKALETENAVLKAGLTDLSDKQRKALLATHDGEMTPEALRSAAIDLGFVSADQHEQVPADEQAAHRAATEAMGAAPPADGTPPSAADRLAAAKTVEELDSAIDALNEELKTVRL